ncbi:MAG: CopG family transcriptional regulator [Pleurocapsa sp.]
MKRFSLRLTEAEYIKLKTYCEEFQLSMNDVVRQLIREWNPAWKMSELSRQKEKNMR